MKLHRNRRLPSLQLATAGMIDIVFLLLIFFLVNSSFRPVERQIESQLTDTSAAVQAPLDPLVIRLQASAERFQFRVGGRDFPNRTMLVEWLREWPEREQQIMIVAPAAAPVELAILTLNDCRNLGFANVSYVPDNTTGTVDGF